MIVHGGIVSPFSRKVHVFCREKGIPFEARYLSPMPKTPELLAMSPLGKIPVLEDEGEFFPDSSVICAYLERKHPESPLYPEAPRALARALFLEEFSDTRALEAFAPALVERVILPRYFDAGRDEERIARTAAEVVPPVFDWLEGQVDPAGCVDGRFTIADCALGAQLQSWQLAGEAVDSARWPKLAAYSEAMLSRPSFVATAEALESEAT